MKLITHQSHLDALPPSPISNHTATRFQGLSKDTDVPPNIILVENGDDITGLDYAFIGPDGLLSDLFEEHEPGHPVFARPYEWVSHMPELNLYEALLLINNEDGILLSIPEAIVDAHPDLKWILTDESQGGLSPPQPF
jgi:hypothetical protein